MKRMVPMVAMAASMFFAASGVSAQCEPDTVNCKDTGLPGQICPQFLPEATTGEEYNASITVLPPGEFTYSGTTIPISYIVVDSVRNLPAGITYEASADIFYPDTAYCVLISGTPVTSGDYTLSIYVSVFINLGTGPIKAAQILDDTSVVMTVLEPTGLEPDAAGDFRVIPTFPNPFPEVTRIGVYSPVDDRITLRVYNILGERMHEEYLQVSSGEHHFRFNGSSLRPGTYFYRITNSRQLYTGKFIKSR